jgi:ankyrin repeat protein
LLRRGAEVDAETEDGRTALFQAAANQHPDAVEVLCEAGGNVCHVLGTGRTMLQAVLMSTSPSYDLAHKLISRGVDVNASDSRERTPLALATAGEQYEIAELLLENGADPC